MTEQTEYAVAAASVVERRFPPKNLDEVRQVLAALNLLNTIVKEPGGTELTSYMYIKGMTACVFVNLIYNPVNGVEIYWDAISRLTYFRTGRWQFSFHYVPLLENYAFAMRRAGMKPQEWDGVRLQGMAREIFDEVTGHRSHAGDEVAEDCHCVCDEECRRMIERMKTFRQRNVCARLKSLPKAPVLVRNVVKERITKYLTQLTGYRWRCLMLALKFNMNFCESFELRRKNDMWRAMVGYYDGTNYRAVAHWLMGPKSVSYSRSETTLCKRGYYYLRRDKWVWHRMTYGRFLMLRAHYNNLLIEGNSYNLCITYGIARYVAMHYPMVRFVNVLNFTRFTVHRRYYTYKDLARVPLHSKSRVLKVWMVVDPDYRLKKFDPSTLPEALYREYERAKDYKSFFKVERKKSGVGLVAYSRFHLLKPVYANVVLFGHYAHVKDSSGKWAIYSLMKECFESDFVYDKIFIDRRNYVLYGWRGDEREVINKLRK